MKRFIPKLFLAVALLTLWTLVSGVNAADKPKNIILFIGDGMSIPQRMMAEDFLIQTGRDGLALNKFPYQVMTRTNSANSLITDSAAAGTAIACGTKTNNGTIGQDPEGKRLESVAEAARDKGMKVGIITSITINHATPASFYGHNISRGNGYELGLDLIASNFNFFGGGAVDSHNDKDHPDFKGDIYDLAKEAGYNVSHDREGFDALKPGDDKVLACKKDGTLDYAIDATNDYPTLSEFTAKAIELLENPNGFFLMVEGGKIDGMCHANDAGTALHEIIAMDDAVKVALKFKEDHPDTLIVVTGDHETGGLTLGFAGTGYETYNNRLLNQTCSNGAFNSKIAKVYKEKKDEITFDDVKPVITESFGFIFDPESDNEMKVTDSELNALQSAFDDAFKNDGDHPSRLTTVVVRIFDNKAGLAWTSGAHTALPVNTSAIGPGADIFAGLIDNTDISKKLKSLLP